MEYINLPPHLLVMLMARGDTTVMTRSPTRNHRKKALRKEFQSLVMLLTLVTTINNDRRLTLWDSPRPYRWALEVGLPTRHRVQNAVSILLVRNSEVVAVATRDPFPHQHVSSTHVSSPYQLWAVQQAPRGVKYSAMEENGIFITSGKSHLHTSAFDNWNNLCNIS
jgi:hypothetical protein